MSDVVRKHKLYLTQADIEDAQKALKGPVDRHEATMMACGQAILDVMNGATLEFPKLKKKP